MSGDELKGMSAAMLSSALGGTAVVATRYLIGGIDPVALAFLRYGIGVLCLAAAFMARRMPPVAPRDRLAVVLLGALFFALFPILFNVALSLTTAARGALALSTMPLVTLIAGALLGVEPLTRPKLLGVGVAILGVACALSGGLAAAPAGAWRGDLVMIGTALCGALYNVLSRPCIRRYDPLAFTVQAMLVGTLLLGLGAGAAGSLPALAALPHVAWLAVLYLGVVGGAGSFFLWSYGLGHTTPTRVAVSIAVNPVVALLLGALLLGEPTPAPLLIGLVAVLAGILLTTREPRRSVATAP
jgi:drug/metabolite transporter (DMT)-like permease